jgi:hypothetical protein
MKVCNRRVNFRSLGGLGELFDYLRDLDSLKVCESYATAFHYFHYKAIVYLSKTG